MFALVIFDLLQSLCPERETFENCLGIEIVLREDVWEL